MSLATGGVGYLSGPHSAYVPLRDPEGASAGYWAGDSALVRLVILDYTARPGETDFDPASISLPAGWAVLGWRVIVRSSVVAHYLPLVHVWVGTKALGATYPTAWSWSPPGTLAPDEQVALAGQRPHWATAQVAPPLAFIFRGEPAVADLSWREDASQMEHVPDASASGSIVAAIETPDALDPPLDPYRLEWQTTDLYGSGSQVDPWSAVVPNRPWQVRGVNLGDPGPARSQWERWRRAMVLGDVAVQGNTTPIPSRAVLAQVSMGTVERPMRPTWTSHTSPTYVDAQRANTFTWRHWPGFAGAQSGYQLKRDMGGVVAYWDAATQAWQSTPITNASTESSVTLPAEALPLNTTATLTVSTTGADTGATLSLESTALQVTSVLLPSPTIIVAGLREDATLVDMTPDIVIGQTGGTGAPVARWEATLTDDGTGQVLASGSGASLGVWRHGVTAVDEQRLTVRARLQIAGGTWTDWSAVSFRVDVTPPETPTVTATVTTHEVSGAPGVEVRAVFTPDPSGTGFAWHQQMVTVRIEREQADGSWSLVGTVSPQLGTLAIDGADWYAPTGVTSRYRVRAEAILADGALLAGGWGESVPLAVAGSGVHQWLVPYGAPELGVRIREFERDPRARFSGGSSVDAHGSVWPIVQSAGTQWHRASSAKIHTFSFADTAALWRCVSSRLLLLHRGCEFRDADGVAAQEPDQWLRITGDISEAMFFNGPTQVRDVTLPYVPQAAPWEAVS